MRWIHARIKVQVLISRKISKTAVYAEWAWWLLFQQKCLQFNEKLWMLNIYCLKFVLMINLDDYNEKKSVNVHSYVPVLLNL